MCAVVCQIIICVYSVVRLLAEEPHRNEMLYKYADKYCVLISHLFPEGTQCALQATPWFKLNHPL